MKIPHTSKSNSRNIEIFIITTIVNTAAAFLQTSLYTVQNCGSASGKTHFLPSTERDLRALESITGRSPALGNARDVRGDLASARDACGHIAGARDARRHIAGARDAHGHIAGARDNVVRGRRGRSVARTVLEAICMDERVWY